MQTQTNVVFSWPGQPASICKSVSTYRVFKLRVDFRDDLTHLFQLAEHVFRWRSTSKHRLHLTVSVFASLPTLAASIAEDSLAAALGRISPTNR